MKESDSVAVVEGMSLVRGAPLATEAGIGALTLGGYLQEVVGRFGPREVGVLHTASGAVRWSYDDLMAHSMAVARSLLACGVGKGTRVGVMMTNRLEFLAGVFGTALAGGVATTMSTFSTPDELEVLVKKSGCSVILFERHVLKKDFAQMLVDLEPAIETTAAGELQSQKFPHLRHLAMIDSDAVGGIEAWDAFLARGARIAPELVEAAAADVEPADPGVLFFSSGSTGKPKGILSAHRGVCLQLWRWCKWLAVGDDVRCWSANGFFWSGNFAMALGGTLSSGGSLILQRTFDAEEALRLMDAEKCTYLFAWPHQWAQLTDASNWLDVDLSSLWYIDAKSPIAQHPTVNTTWREPTYAYGNTETFTLSTVYPANTPEDVAAKSHGLPVHGMTLKVVDPMTGEVLPLGESGEIAVKGPTLMLGYIGVPLQESLDDEGFFRTGDGGHFDAVGRLYWEGRLNDIIKTGGANVSPIEVDGIIAKHPGVKVTRTVGVADELLGELVVTCIVPKDGVRLTVEEVRGFAKEKLASYKCPREVLFFNEDELETTGTAKIKLAELRELATNRLAELNA